MKMYLVEREYLILHSPTTDRHVATAPQTRAIRQSTMQTKIHPKTHQTMQCLQLVCIIFRQMPDYNNDEITSSNCETWSVVMLKCQELLLSLRHLVSKFTLTGFISQQDVAVQHYQTRLSHYGCQENFKTESTSTMSQ